VTHEPAGVCLGDILLEVILENDDVEGVPRQVFYEVGGVCEGVSVRTVEPTQFLEECSRHTVRDIHKLQCVTSPLIETHDSFGASTAIIDAFHCVLLEIVGNY